MFPTCTAHFVSVFCISLLVSVNSCMFPRLLLHRNVLDGGEKSTNDITNRNVNKHLYPSGASVPMEIGVGEGRQISCIHSILYIDLCSWEHKKER